MLLVTAQEQNKGVRKGKPTGNDLRAILSESQATVVLAFSINFEKLGQIQERDQFKLSEGAARLTASKSTLSASFLT